MRTLLLLGESMNNSNSTAAAPNSGSSLHLDKSLSAVLTAVAEPHEVT